VVAARGAVRKSAGVMAFIRIKGITGLVFAPEQGVAAPRKHRCPDCHSCQWCGDERCATCRGQGGGCARRRKRAGKRP